jgi:hypothetical protein
VLLAAAGPDLLGVVSAEEVEGNATGSAAIDSLLAAACGGSMLWAAAEFIVSSDICSRLVASGGAGRRVDARAGGEDTAGTSAAPLCATGPLDTGAALSGANAAGPELPVLEGVRSLLISEDAPTDSDSPGVVALFAFGS